MRARASRYSLIATYYLLSIGHWCVFFCDTFPPHTTYDRTHPVDFFPFAIVALLYWIHYMISYRYLQHHGKAVSFHFICGIADLLFIYWIAATNFIRFREVMVLVIIILRFSSILLLLKKTENELMN